MGTLADSELVARALENPGRLVYGPTSNSGSFPFGGRTIGIKRHARLRFLAEYQDVRDPASGGLQYVARRKIEQPRLIFMLDPPWDVDVLPLTFNSTASGTVQSPEEAGIVGSVIPKGRLKTGAGLLFVADDMRHLSVYFRLFVSRLSFDDASDLGPRRGAPLPLIFDPIQCIDSTDSGYPYLPTKSPWSVRRLENMVEIP